MIITKFLRIAILLIPVSCLATEAKIHVWDNVMDAASGRILHQVASAKGLGHTLLNRQQSPASPLEYALSQILQELNDTSVVVEYWARQEWRHIEAHADVDEYRAKAGGDLLYPTHGHVLYLDIGPQVRGPTCIFPGCVSGGDLADDNKQALSVVTVPAVSGRLLRFPGHWLHAVPRPMDIWMLPFVKGSPDFSEEFQRSVVLFNTWNEEPPMEVKPLEVTSCTEEERRELIHKFAKWQAREVIESPTPVAMSQRTKIWLLGDLKRRNYTLRTVQLYSHGETLREALHEESQPKSTPLSQVAMEA